MAKKRTAKQNKVAAAKRRGRAGAKTAKRKARKRAARTDGKGRSSAPLGTVHLTAREEEIFRLLSLGCTVKEAAAILQVAPSTADNHKARLMAKLGTDKAALVTRLALKMKVTSMSDTLTTTEKRRSGRKRDGWN